MFCKNCGNESQTEAKYCPKCGHRLNSADSDNSAEEWFYVSSGNSRCGPYSHETMISLIQREHITRDTLVWKSGMLEWIPAIQTELLQTIKDVAPPLPISNKYVWSLATVPLLISWFIEALALPSAVVTIVTIALNVTFMVLDSKRLEKSGIRTENWMWMGLVLVPAYLFLRASKTDKKYGYAIAWCLMFLADLFLF